MPKENFDFSKKKDQKQFDDLPKKAKEVLVNDAFEEAKMSQERAEEYAQENNEIINKYDPKERNYNDEDILKKMADLWLLAGKNEKAEDIYIKLGFSVFSRDGTYAGDKFKKAGDIERAIKFWRYALEYSGDWDKQEIWIKIRKNMSYNKENIDQQINDITEEIKVLNSLYNESREEDEETRGRDNFDDIKVSRVTVEYIDKINGLERELRELEKKQKN